MFLSKISYIRKLLGFRRLLKGANCHSSGKSILTDKGICLAFLLPSPSDVMKEVNKNRKRSVVKVTPIHKMYEMKEDLGKKKNVKMPCQ